MTENPQHDRMKAAFDKARHAAAADDFRTPQRWAQTREIERKAERLRELSQQRFKNEYQERLAREIKRLLDDRYSPTRQHKPNGVADSNDITRQADKNIRKHQEQRIARITRSEENMVNELRREAREMRGLNISFERPATKQRHSDFRRLR